MHKAALQSNISIQKKAALPIKIERHGKLIVVVMQAGQPLQLFQPELQQSLLQG
jgi:hypothetical protein